MKRARSIRVVSPDRLNNSGFTLIEVLIATMVLGAMIYLATFSYSAVLNVWGQRRLTDVRALSEYRNHALCRSALESVFDYYVTDPVSERQGAFYPYFKGEPDQLQFVTLSSVFHKGLPAAARLKVTAGSGDAEGTYLVTYEEMPLNRWYIRYDNQEPAYTDAMVVYENIRAFKIRYYGLGVVGPFSGPGQTVVKTAYDWYERFDGSVTRSIPELIEIQLYTEGNGETRLVFPVRVYNPGKRIAYSAW
jgi:prepilin-type N-terminal cleavage/methylation domain-containing protein